MIVNDIAGIIAFTPGIIISVLFFSALNRFKVFGIYSFLLCSEFFEFSKLEINIKNILNGFYNCLIRGGSFSGLSKTLYLFGIFLLKISIVF